MIDYKISDKFANDEITFPFNITYRDGESVNNFWNEIMRVVTQINNDTKCKVRFMWIDAESYCQTEVFLKKILKKHHADYPVLYLHWIDYVHKHNSVNTIIQQAIINDIYFVNEPSLKICVVDHAEQIGEIDQYSEICDEFNNNPCIFIFLSKRGSELNPEYWDNTVQKAQEKNNNALGIIRSSQNYYQVKPYSIETCKLLMTQVLVNEEIRNVCLNMANNSLDYELRRPYYFDLLISIIKKYTSVNEIPDTFNDTLILQELYMKAINGVIEHLTGEISFENFIESYYQSDFVKKSSLDQQKRVPIDSYAYAYGVLYYTPRIGKENYYKNAIEYMLKKIGIDYTGSAFDQFKNINVHIIKTLENFTQGQKNFFVLHDYFVQLAQYNLYCALVCASVLNENFEKIESQSIQKIFHALGKIYQKKVESNQNIRIHVLLGMELGKLLPKLDNESILCGLNSFFMEITDQYVVPVCNENGISVIPVTNYEYEKFVNDNGYANYYNKEFTQPINNIALIYYKEIFDFIVGALDGTHSDDSRCLAKLLKGYDWLQYKQIAYLYSQREAITNTIIYEAIQNSNYPKEIKFPAKWADEANSKITKAFCNPLQPVVCVNLFEARAYAKWLENKIHKNVRVLKYDPDYLSIVGTLENGENDKQRQVFLEHLKNNEDFINSAENSKYFFGHDDIEVREPSPVAIPDSNFVGLFDFVGNLFETQDTPYDYQYSIDVSPQTMDEFERREIALIDYNCPGGGLQRTKANWPPAYMGQVPAFLRNQDIGFRIVIDGNEEATRKFENEKFPSNIYDNKNTEVFVPMFSSNDTLLDHITIDSISTPNEIYIKSKVFCFNATAIVFFSKNIDDDNLYGEYIMLVEDSDNIFAYYLDGLSIIKTKNDNEMIHVIVQKPIISQELSTKRKYSNIDMASWIELITFYKRGVTEIYRPHGVNIVNGYFSIPKHNVYTKSPMTKNTHITSNLFGDYRLLFDNASIIFRENYYSSINKKLGANFFLPDWIDIVDFINYLSTFTLSSKKLDVDIVLAAITTIDTADLHEQINTKKLFEIENKKK